MKQVVLLSIALCLGVFSLTAMYKIKKTTALNLNSSTDKDDNSWDKDMESFALARDDRLRREFDDSAISATYGMSLLQFSNKRRDHFNLYVKNVVSQCNNLISFEYGVKLMEGSKYEIVFQLSKLKSLYIWVDSPLRNDFLRDLKNKGKLIETLSIKGEYLPAEQVERICDILKSRVVNLCVWCESVPLEHLLKLQKLKSLHIQMPSITNEQVMELVKGLPNLEILNMRQCQLVTEQFVPAAREWLTNNNKQQKLTIYMERSAAEQDMLLLEVIQKGATEIVPLNGESSTAHR